MQAATRTRLSRQVLRLLSVPVFACLVAGGGPARAQDAACAAFAWPLEREYALLSSPNVVALETGARIRVGEAAAVALRPMGDVAFVKPPERQPKVAPSYAAALTLEAAAAGFYQITLSEDAWLDVVQNDAILRSAAFSGKQGCAGMRKSVRFELAQAPAVVQISGAAARQIRIVVTAADR